MDYRERLLAGVPYGLLHDHARPKAHRCRPRIFQRALSRRQAGLFKEFARDENATSFAVFQAAFIALLFRWSREDEIVTAVPRSEHAEPLILRCHVEPQESFRSLLHRNRDRSSDALRNTDAAPGAGAQSGRPPFFPLCFQYASANAAPAKADLSFDADLGLRVLDTAQGLILEWKYDSALFELSTMEALAESYEVLLDALPAHMDTPLANIELLREEKCRALLDESCNEIAYPRDADIASLVEEQAAARPDAVAIEHGDRVLCYGELDERATRIAYALRAKGAQAGDRIGVCMERSPELVSALLAILKLGCVYVPLDADAPKARLAHMVEDTGMRLLLSDGHCAVPEKPACLNVQDCHADEAQPALPRPPGGEHPAYVMYTSGSTGTPKGVVVTHRGVVRLVSNTDYARLDTDTVMAQVSNAAFDAATFEIWGALCNGGRLVVLDREQALDPTSFADVARTRGLTTGFLTSSLFSRFAQERPDSFSGFRDLLVGGEQVSVDAVRCVLDAGPPERLSNGYGPTENTTFSTWCALTREHVRRGVMPIGRPIAHSACYVVNEALILQPDGAVGELVVSGDGLATGYWQRPLLTSERFVESPASWGKRIRLYRTGDLVRRLPTGEIEYLGRMDNQVKLRGFRIEPGEIEQALREHPAVAHAAVRVHGDAQQESRHLVAWWVPRANEIVEAGQLHDHLATRLPAYMLPVAYVSLQELPLNMNGKLDHRALPEPRSADYLRAAFEAPQEGTESELAAIWRQLLGHEEIGRKDGFIELGGNSLQLTRLAGEIRTRFGVPLPFRAMYEARTVAALAALIEAQRETASGTLPPLEPSADAPRPLSHAQESLLFIDRLNGDDAGYNLFYAWRLRGTIDINALREAFQELLSRHESLRTVFRETDGVDHQHLLEAAEFAFKEEVPRAGVGATPESTVAALAEAESLAPFDLSRDMPLRARLLRIGEDDRVLMLTLHHIAADGWSLAILLDEVSALYARRLEKQAGTLPPLELQYADYARWQRALLEGEGRESDIAWWQRQLDDLPVTHQLPRDVADTGAERQGGLFRTRLDDVTVKHLQEFALREDATLYMVLQTAFAAALSRFSGETDIVIGTPVANRADSRLDRLIGYFVNTVILRSNLDGNPGFRELLARNRDVVLDAFEHQQLPFEMLVEALNPERDPDTTPLFQIMFVLQNNESGELRFPGVQIEALPRQSAVAKFDLTLNATPDAEGLELEWEYRADRFTAAIIERLAEGYRLLLDGVLADPERPVQELPVLTEADRARLLSWSEMPVHEVPDQRLHVLFEAVAAARPDATALRYRNETITFRELNERAERLADFLCAGGVARNALVGLCLRRTPQFLVSVLAVWKAGAAYVPLDPEVPVARHEYIVNDAGIRCVLTETALASNFEGSDRRILCLDAEELQRKIATAPRRAPAALKSDDLAYVIYTSGSTGEPKGVLVEHRAVSRLLAAPAELGYGADTVMLQSVNAAFDASLLETWAPLCCGGQLVLYPGQGLEVAALGGLIAEHGINTVTLPAALLDLWVEQLHGATGLACIVVGGEALSAATVKRLYQLDDHVVVVNHYGPTENGVLTSWYRIPRDVPAPVPIGYPVPGTQLHVVNEAGQLQPPGVVGELHVTGQGVARGYLGRSELTAEKFRLPGDGAAREYRTGDLVCWRETGDARSACLHFVGRRDQQVKIRGFRIELGEIEAKLRGCAGVQDTRVIVQRGAQGEKQLLAYVIADSAAHEDSERWREQLRESLPAYMVPAAFVRVAAWPLTRNGKLDAKALPLPDRDAFTQRTFVAPANSIEERLLAIWRELLRLERISVEDGFFDLGGHSLLATRLHNRIRAEFSAELPLRAMFEAQTVRQQAARLVGVQEKSLPKPVPSVSSSGADAPLSYAQQRMWFIQRLEGDSAQYHIPWRVRLNGHLDVKALRNALRDIVRRHAILHTVFREKDGEPRLVVLPFAEFALPVHDVSGLDEAARIPAAMRCLHEEVQRPFDLAQDVTLRGCLIRMSDTEHWLALTVHHIVADGWAMDILARELATLYAAHRAGEPSPLPALPLQYADYARWQQEWLDEKALEPHFRFWEEKLHDLPLLHNLPLDRPRPSMQTDRGALHRQVIPAALIERLQALVKQRGATLFMGLHSAFALLLARFSGETDIVVGTPVANRRDESLSSLIGLFINTLVFRSDLSGNPGFLDLLEASRNHALDAYEHQDLPFELLVERLNPERNASHGPLFQVLFALQNNEAAGLELADLEAGAIPFTERYAKFDLALNLLPAARGLVAEWEYNADLFEASSIERMARAYDVLLEKLLDAPDAPVLSLPLLDAVERERVLTLGNDTARPYPQDECLHELIERQVRSTPDAPAVLCDGDAITYAELNRQANRLARHLRYLGAGPDVPVGIVMERGPQMIVALLAILKAGSAYAPIDPDYPRARLAAMLADCRPVVVLSGGAALAVVNAACEELAAGQRPRVLDMLSGSAWSREDGTDLETAATGVTAAHVAYIIYTSGSTGRPKGVMNEHRAILNRLHWMQEAWPLDSADRFLQTAAVAFGASVVEIFWPLLNGTPLVLTRPEGHKDPAYLIDVILEANVTALHFVPSMLQAFLDHPRAQECRGLKHIFCGGEAMPGALARRCREILPRTCLHHLYGSSETAVLATGWDCTAEALPDNIPIGKPGANTRIYILDAYGQPVPRGVRGEIHIAGRQVARGYLNHDALNAERFLPDPFSSEPGARMYRTGDLGRQLPDGSIEHLGRNDFQIKIRGQRVELTDIEAQLLAHDDVRQAAVLARDYGDGEPRLVAYVVAEQAQGAEDELIDGLRRHLQTQLPSHMQPVAYMVMEKFPLNANGKLDRGALPLPELYRAAAHHVPPETGLQQQLAEIWQELLRQPRPGIDDDFFAAGGHSLLVLRLGNRVREAFDYELDLKEFFAAPTIRALAAAVERYRQARLAAERFHEFEAAEVVEF